MESADAGPTLWNTFAGDICPFLLLHDKDDSADGIVDAQILVNTAWLIRDANKMRPAGNYRGAAGDLTCSARRQMERVQDVLTSLCDGVVQKQDVINCRLVDLYLAPLVEEQMQAVFGLFIARVANPVQGYEDMTAAVNYCLMSLAACVQFKVQVPLRMKKVLRVFKEYGSLLCVAQNNTDLMDVYVWGGCDTSRASERRLEYRCAAIEKTLTSRSIWSRSV